MSLSAWSWVEVPSNTGQAGSPVFAIATLTALLAGGDGEPAPGSQSVRLTERVLPQLTAKTRARSPHPFHPPPSEGCDAQVTSGDEQEVALPALPAICAGCTACSWPWHLLLLALMHGEEELAAHCFGDTRPVLHLAWGSTSLSLQHPKAARQALHRCWERGKRNRCCAPEWYLPREVSSDLL